MRADLTAVMAVTANRLSYESVYDMYGRIKAANVERFSPFTQSCGG